MNFNMLLSYFTDFRFILLVLLGSVLGLFIGAIPGLSVTMATALLVSVTYSWSASDAMATIMGLYVVGVFSGALSAILINIPGAPSSVVTAFDGYPLSKRGESNKALKYATVYSFIGSWFCRSCSPFRPYFFYSLKIPSYRLLPSFILWPLGSRKPDK